MIIAADHDGHEVLAEWRNGTAPDLADALAVSLSCRRIAAEDLGWILDVRSASDVLL